MARAQYTDYLQAFRFFCQIIPNSASTGTRIDLLTSGATPAAGFMSITTPSITFGVAEYREGTQVYTRRFPGIPTMDNITLTRGVARGDSTFWQWAQATAEGGTEYRVDLDIKHFHRDDSLTGVYPPSPTQNAFLLNPSAAPGKIYHVHEAFVTQCTPTSELNSSTNDVSIGTLQISYEYFDVEDGTPIAGPGNY